MTTIQTKLGTISVPSQWAELPPQTILKLIEVRFNYFLVDDMIHRSRQRLTVLHLLSRIPIPAISKLPDTELYDLLRATQWAIDTRLDCKPFAYFTHKGTRYYLPAPKLADTTAGELSIANLYYLAYSQPKGANYNAIYDLIATLCRPRRWDYPVRRWRTDYDGDDRQPFNSVLADRTARQFAKGLPVATIMAVLQYFEQLLDEFMTRYADIFDEDESLKPLFANGEGWLALLEDVAESATFGDYEQVFEKNCHTVWMYLRHKKVKSDRAREDYEAQQQENSTS